MSKSTQVFLILVGSADDQNYFIVLLLNPIMSGEELRCKECGLTFDTIESLEEHIQSERQTVEFRNKGVDDG